MKELSIEDKANRYDKAIEIAKSKIKNDKDHVLYEDDVIEIFPELKESENEKVIRDIKVVLECSATKFFKEEGKMPIWYDRAVAWLEKQGEQKLVVPKFKVGDWVVLEVGELLSVLKIDRIDEHRKKYWFHDGSYLPIVDDDCLRLWTIQDAKEGDVLRLGCVIAIFKSIFKNSIGNPKCVCYCSFYKDRGFEIPIENGEDNVYGCTNTTPATQEERDLLFQRMSEDGYEWDADAKVLYKVTIYES